MKVGVQTNIVFFASENQVDNFIAELHIRESLLFFDRENNQLKILCGQYIGFQSFFGEFQSKFYRQI